MYKVNHPKIHLTILESYDVKTKEFTRKCEDIVFNDVQELISFLVPNTYPRLNYMGNPVCNQFKNVYWDYQTLNGTTYYYEDYTALRGYGIPNGYIKTDWNHMIGKYMFWLDSPGCPYYDVRNLKKEVINRYISEYPEYNNPHMMLWLKKFTVRQNRSRHSLKYDRTNSKYIKRVKEFDGLKHDEPEYRLLAKPKDKELFIYSYDEDNFTHNHSGTGWKDNSGKKFRHQWERKEYRIFKRWTY